jgi:ferritin-like metal-binding protein YciE
MDHSLGGESMAGSSLFSSTRLDSLKTLLIDQLQDLYDAEEQLVKALPKMASAAIFPELKSAFQEHLQETKGHVKRLEQAFEKLGTKAKRQTCEAMEGLVEDGSDMMKQDAEPSVRDAGLICAAQKVEHYEMAGYGCVRTWAQELGFRDVAQLLQQNFEEEKAADEKLTRVAESMVNLQAAQPAKK